MQRPQRCAGSTLERNWKDRPFGQLHEYFPFKSYVFEFFFSREKIKFVGEKNWKIFDWKKIILKGRYFFAKLKTARNSESGPPLSRREFNQMGSDCCTRQKIPANHVKQLFRAVKTVIKSSLGSSKWPISAF